MNRQFSKEEAQMASKYIRKYLTSLAIKEMQIKTTLRFHLTTVKIALINNIYNNKCWGGCGEKGRLLQYC
jgi:hypothetical protein